MKEAQENELPLHVKIHIRRKTIKLPYDDCA
jgi:hypothetical protein